MARGSSSYTWATSSLANYKNTYQPMSVVLNQASPRTADTGQVNWATIATEPTVIRDYEIFALGGSLQATAPVFLRIDYMGGTTSGQGGIQVTVGTTTDGAGNLGGLTVPLLDLQQHTLSTGNPQWVWAASDRESYFTFLYALEPLATGIDGVGMFVIERTRDLTGAPTAAGFHVWRWAATSPTVTAYQGGWSRVFGAQTQTSVVDWNFGMFCPDFFNLTTGLAPDTTAYSWPAYTYTPLQPGGASKALLFGFPGDFPRGQAVTVSHYGEPMTFVTLGDAVAQTLPVLNASNGATTKTLMPLIRWD